MRLGPRYQSVGQPSALARLGKAGGAVLGIALTALPAPATAVLTWRFRPQQSAYTTSGGRITQITDLINGYNAVEGGSGIGPKLGTDRLGRKHIDLEGSEWLDLASVPATNPRAFGFFMVCRVHQGSNAIMPIASIKGAATGRAHVNVGGGLNNTAPFLANSGFPASGTTNGNAAKGIVGHQLQVIGVVSRTTALGGTRLYVNNDVNTVAQNSGGTATGGWEIGRYSTTPGSSGAWGKFTAYDIIEYEGTLSNAEADAIQAALVAAWGIPPIEHSAVIDGDSQHYGFVNDAGAVPTAQNLGMQLTEPGSPYCVPPNWRVVTVAVSGNTIASLITRRDTANSIFSASLMLPGRNEVIVQIGPNDVGVSGNAVYPGTTFGTVARGDDVYSNLVTNYLPTLLSRGFEVRQVVNMASGNASIQTALAEIRVRVRAGAFLTDITAGSGQTYDGKVSRIELPLVTVGGQTVFDTSADAANTTYYQSDTLHPNVAGIAQMVTAYRPAL